LSAAINLVLNDPSKKEMMITAGTEYIKNFEDHNIAGKIMELYQKLTLNA
jgi:hypothetical protein